MDGGSWRATVQGVAKSWTQLSDFTSLSCCCSCAVLSHSVEFDSLRPQAPLTVGISRQEYRSGLPFPSPGDLPNPGIKPASPALQADALASEPPGKPLIRG